MSKKFYKLGDKARSFSDPTTKVKLVTKDQVIELTAAQLKSKKIIAAIKGGHLEQATAEDYDNYVNSVNVEATEENTDFSNSSAGKKLYTQEEASALTKDKLKEVINTYEHDSDLKGFNKEELVDFLIELQEEAED